MIDPKIFTLPWVLSWCLGLPSSSDWSSNGWNACTPCAQWTTTGESLNLLPDGNFDPNSFAGLPYFGFAVNPIDPTTPPDSLCEGYLDADYGWETSPENTYPKGGTYLQISITFYGETVYSYYSAGDIIASRDTISTDPNTGITITGHAETRRYYFSNCIMANIWRDNIGGTSAVRGAPCFVPFDTVVPSAYEYPVIDSNQFTDHLLVYRRTRYSYAYYGNPQ